MSRDVELPQAHTMETKFDFALWVSWQILTSCPLFGYGDLKTAKES